jgi:PAS domain S-box-containing protein
MLNLLKYRVFIYIVVATCFICNATPLQDVAPDYQGGIMKCFGGNELSPHCLETILQTVAEGILVCDSDLIIRFANNSLLELTGYSAEELTGRNTGEIVICSGEHMPLSGLNNFECTIRRKNGHTIPVLRNSRPIIDENGSVSGTVSSFSDISELRKTQHKLSGIKTLNTAGGFEGIIGKSSQMQEVFELIELAAASNATVLISGETGTGKELAARAIHNRSLRRDAPFVAVNCSALPESLLESELFGHTKGAFTGAIRDKTGRFEMASGGTLFLDEIGEIPPVIQVKLLRFLQLKEFERVGESVTRKADVRIITATNRDLKEMTGNGEFRDDLYYRLKVFPIHMPPLREHKEDVGMLVRHFIDRFNNETGKSLSGLTHDAAVTLMDYCWPGNIRELENAIEHAFVTCKQGEIDLFDLPLEIRRVELRQGTCMPSRPQNTGTDSRILLNTPAQPFRAGKEEILSALESCRWNKAAAAIKLGMDRTTLWRKMKRLKISA